MWASSENRRTSIFISRSNGFQCSNEKWWNQSVLKLRVSCHMINTAKSIIYLYEKNSMFAMGRIVHVLQYAVSTKYVCWFFLILAFGLGSLFTYPFWLVICAAEDDIKIDFTQISHTSRMNVLFGEICWDTRYKWQKRHKMYYMWIIKWTDNKVNE